MPGTKNTNYIGIDFNFRLDIPEVLEWIEGFMP